MCTLFMFDPYHVYAYISVLSLVYCVFSRLKISTETTEVSPPIAPPAVASAQETDKEQQKEKQSKKRKGAKIGWYIVKALK